MRLSSKVVVDLATSRLIARDTIQATECIAWCSRNHILAPRAIKHAFSEPLNQALVGYSGLPFFPVVELAAHCWFVGRSSHPYAQSFMACGLQTRQKSGWLQDNQRLFITKFAQAFEEDVRPIVKIVCDSYAEANPEEDRELHDPALFAEQLVRTYEWVCERSLDFANSPQIPKGMKSLGEAALVPFIDVVPHASKQANSAVCVTSNDCGEKALMEWAAEVDLEYNNDLHLPVLLLATRKINPGREILRDCSTRLVGVTNGAPGRKLPVLYSK